MEDSRVSIGLDLRQPKKRHREEFGIDTASYADASGIRIVSFRRRQSYQYESLGSRVNSRAVDSTHPSVGKGRAGSTGQHTSGIAGLGGVGSIARRISRKTWGVGELVMVDFDIVSEENLNRLVGARRDEIGKPKVEYAARIALKQRQPVSSTCGYSGECCRVGGLEATFGC